MSCKTYRNRILLEQSGELGAFRRALLKRHIAGCAECHKFKEETAIVTDAARKMTADPDSAQIENILSFARREVSRSEEFRFRPSREPLLRQWRPALLYAGLSILLFIAFFAVISPVLHPSRQGAETAVKETPSALAWDDGFDEQLDELNNMLATAAKEWSNGDASELDEIERLARELLELEGMQI
jgi:flagellar biosynthesis/type III secretory pathway M-ring protein FliF/YscJ